MLTHTVYYYLLGGWILLALIVFGVLIRVPAPYGRFVRPGWGPGLSSRWSWLLMESPAATLGVVPAEELGPGDRQRPTRGQPAGLVAAVTHRAPGSQDDFQRDLPNPVGSPPEVVSSHGTWLPLRTAR
jgi:hypothetical protein